MCRGQGSSQRPQPGPVTGSLGAERAEAGEARDQGRVEAGAG